MFVEVVVEVLSKIRSNVAPVGEQPVKGKVLVKSVIEASGVDKTLID